VTFALHLTAIALAMFLHEGGHYLVARLLSLKVHRFGIGPKGPYVLREQGAPVQDFLVSIAGPAVNLLLLSLWALWPFFGVANLFFAATLFLTDGRHARAAWRLIQLDIRAAQPIECHAEDAL
jgi:hypothetical protein